MKKSFSLSAILATIFFALCAFFVQTPHIQAACSIASAKFEPSGIQDENWFKDSSKPIVKVHLVSTGCEGQTIELSIVGNDQLTPDDDIFGFDNRQFTIPQSGKLSIITKAGEDECEIDTNVFDYSIGNADCEYYLNIVGADDYNSNGQPEGGLAFECDGVCDENWTHKKSGDTETITIDGSGNITNEQLSTNTYTFLAPLPGLSEVTGNEGVADFIERLFIIMISLAGVLSVLSLIYAGFLYITTGVFNVKTAAKERIWNSILGLLLALGAFIILNTINPDLVNNLGLNIATVTLTTPGDTEDPLISNFQPLSGMVCPGNGGKAQIPTIANSFVNKVTYKMGGKGSGNGSTIFLDCSGFVSQVIKCAGGSDQGGTINIFSGNGVEAVTTITNTAVNGVTLQPGDLLGWKVGSTEPFGHVVIYVGNGKVMDSHGPANKTNKAIGTLDSTYYKNQDGSSRIKFIRRTTLN